MGLSKVQNFQNYKGVKMSDWWTDRWSRGKSTSSAWKGQPQHVCAICGKQIAYISESVPYGKNAHRHSTCHPAEPKSQPIVQVLPPNVKKSCKGKKGWRKRHPELV